MKLSEFAKSEKREEKADIKEDLNKKYETLKNLPHDELLERLRDEIKRQKASGEFDYDSLVASLNAVKMYLPSGAYENMIRIIDEINGKD